MPLYAQFTHSDVPQEQTNPRYGSRVVQESRAHTIVVSPAHDRMRERILLLVAKNIIWSSAAGGESAGLYTLFVLS